MAGSCRPVVAPSKAHTQEAFIWRSLTSSAACEFWNKGWNQGKRNSSDERLSRIRWPNALHPRPPRTSSRAAHSFWRRRPSQVARSWPAKRLGPLHIGLVTDLHYADKPPAGTRHYRETLAKLAEAAEQFEKDKPRFRRRTRRPDRRRRLGRDRAERT